MKRIFLLLMMMGILSRVLFAWGNKEEPDRLIWLTSVHGSNTPAGMDAFIQEIERLTGIKVKIIKAGGSAYGNKLAAMLSSGEPLDIIYADFRPQYIVQGFLEPLDSRIAASPVLSDPEIIPPEEWERVRFSDGKIYGVFNKFEQGTLPTVRQDWLDNLGLERPQTMEEYYQVLKAFTTEDPDGNGKDDTYGLSVGYVIYDISPLFGAYGLKQGFQYDESGELYSPWSTEAAVPVYEFMARLYAEGILDPNFITNKSSDFRNSFMSGHAGMTMYWAAWVGLFNQKVKTEFPQSSFQAAGLAPPRGPQGHQGLRAGSDGLLSLPVNSSRKDQAFKLLEFWHTYQGNLLGSLGVEGYDYIREKGSYVLTKAGQEAGMDHGAPQPKSLQWRNPLGENEGYQEAEALIRQYADHQMITPYDGQWGEIIRAEAAKIILGKVSPQEGIANMNQRFKEEGIY